ncbi:Hypothetical predicted protein [Cloeon dipterum]|uniref:POU-specific domain-containing protein n=1 Tax=Cloeon dipterum TaxID=197152 RepID=A0A8S1BPA8_9INSE|nr:Hypothetical predicted protein [Cloeon dipterum]
MLIHDEQPQPLDFSVGAMKKKVKPYKVNSSPDGVTGQLHHHHNNNNNNTTPPQLRDHLQRTMHQQHHQLSVLAAPGRVVHSCSSSSDEDNGPGSSSSPRDAEPIITRMDRDNMSSSSPRGHLNGGACSDDEEDEEMRSHSRGSVHSDAAPEEALAMNEDNEDSTDSDRGGALNLVTDSSHRNSTANGSPASPATSRGTSSPQSLSCAAERNLQAALNAIQNASLSQLMNLGAPNPVTMLQNQLAAISTLQSSSSAAAAFTSLQNTEQMQALQHALSQHQHSLQQQLQQFVLYQPGGTSAASPQFFLQNQGLVPHQGYSNPQPMHSHRNQNHAKAMQSMQAIAQAAQQLQQIQRHRSPQQPQQGSTPQTLPGSRSSTAPPHLPQAATASPQQQLAAAGGSPAHTHVPTVASALHAATKAAATMQAGGGSLLDGVNEETTDLEELEQFAKTFKQRRIKLGKAPHLHANW